MDPKNAPYKCPCGQVYWNEDSFHIHLKDCTEAQIFMREVEHYRRLTKYLVNPEDFK